MAEIELLPCPFCGADPTSARLDSYEPVLYEVRCRSCGLVMFWDTDERVVAETWNRRFYAEGSAVSAAQSFVREHDLAWAEGRAPSVEVFEILRAAAFPEIPRQFPAASAGKDQL